jgi:putative toxin-antitoxin system antitoxin component (TIGR02293 family)
MANLKIPNFSDPAVSYGLTDDRHVLSFIELIRQGIPFKEFLNFVKTFPFSMSEWSVFLHLSERTMQRYQREKRKFDALQSEKILEIALLYKKGTEVMGNAAKFNSWLETENLSLGKVKPKSLLDSTFGIGLIKDELLRIEAGILA